MRVVVHLQRTNAGREVDDAGQGVRLQPLHQRVDAKAQRNIQHQRAIFDQQIAVAGRTVGHRNLLRCFRNTVQHRIV